MDQGIFHFNQEFKIDYILSQILGFKLLIISTVERLLYCFELIHIILLYVLLPSFYQCELEDKVVK